MSESGFRIIELQRQLVELVPSVGGVRFAAIAERVHFRLRHGGEILSDLQILVEYLQAVDASDGRGHGQAHGLTQSFFRGDDAVFDGLTVTVQRFHS